MQLLYESRFMMHDASFLTVCRQPKSERDNVGGKYTDGAAKTSRINPERINPECFFFFFFITAISNFPLVTVKIKKNKKRKNKVK